MWYEGENQFYRAPVPPTFDQLVQKREDQDNVLYKSVVLSSTMRDSVTNDLNQKSQPEIINGKNTITLHNDDSDIIEPISEENSIDITDDDLNLSEKFPLDSSLDNRFDTSDSSLMESLKQSVNKTHPKKIVNDPIVLLKSRIAELEKINEEKDKILQEKDNIIQDLERQIAELKTESSIDYKQAYLSTKFEFDQLKVALAKQGKIKKVSVKSARAINPNFHQKLK